MRRQALLETALVFAVFCVQGAWPVPDVNEPTYVGKAIHFWNPAWAQGDFFFDTADTHSLFYLAFGWLTLVLPPQAVCWFGRVLTWWLLAWAWRRLSFALIARPWLAVLTATLLVMLVQRFNMAGEWLIGGVEAKGFAFVLVLLGLEALVRGQWNRTWVLLGAASAFHVLAGGWSAVAAGMAWLGARSTPGADCPQLRRMWKGLLAGLLLAMVGLMPALMLNYGATAEVVREANRIYVFERLPHHLNPLRFPPSSMFLFAAMCLAWLCVRRGAEDPSWRRLRGYVDASVFLAAAGFVLGLMVFFARDMAAGLLRFYWFRLADFAMPLGLVLGVVRWLAGRSVERASSLASSQAGTLMVRAGASPRLWLGVLTAVAVFHVSDCVVMRLFSAPPHADRVPDPAAWKVAAGWFSGPDRRAIFPRPPRADRLPKYDAWRRACEWVAQPGNVPSDAVFLTPRMSQTFTWYAQRGEVATWKEVPQDAAGLVAWWRRIRDLHETRGDSEVRWYASPADLGARRLRELADRYGADYVIMEAGGKPLALAEVYRNEAYVIYRLR